MPIIQSITRPLLSPLARGVGEGVGLGHYAGMYASEATVGSILPFGTAAINESTATGAASRTLSIDSAVTFNGKPTTKLTIGAGGSASFVEVGVTTAALNLNALAQDVMNRRIFVLVKSDGANTITGFSLYMGDGTYANFRTFQNSAPVQTPEGWTLFERTIVGASSTTGTPPSYASPTRAKLRLNLAANNVAGSFWFAFAGALPAPKPTVVFTCDDGYDEWVWLAAEAKARRIPISFGISADLVGTPGFLTSAQVQAIGNDPSGLFECTNHQRGNNTLTTLGLTAYADAVDYCRDYLVGLGLDPYAARIHQYVQGDYSAALITELKARGYVAGRAVGASNEAARNLTIAEAPAGTALFDVPVACHLGNTETLATVQGYLTTQVQRGTAFIMGHKFASAAATDTYVDGYDANYGALDLLDWLASKRDNDGWRLMRWSDWVRLVTSGQPLIS